MGAKRACAYDYEVVIAGGSYAGLAAARQLGRRALVIDQHQIGAVQHSACGTPLGLARRLGGDDCVLQVYDAAYFHSPHGVARFPLREPYCIFDHALLCRRMFNDSGAAFLRARIQRLDGLTVRTSAGAVTARLLIDASGWPAVLARERAPALRQPRQLTAGIEAEIPGRDEGIHFFVDPAIVPAGYAWIFPAGDELRVGVASYERGLELKAALQRFLQARGLVGRPRRGGLIPWFARPPVIDGIYLTGDAAGHCLPLTAEGIRFAIQDGELAGSLVRRVLDGELSAAEGERHYVAAQARADRARAALRRLQCLSGRVPALGFAVLASALAQPVLAPRFERRYARIGAAGEE